MTATPEFLAQQEHLADEAFAAFNFGPDIKVEDHGHWDVSPNDGMDDYTKVVSVTCADDPAGADSHQVSFHVKFKAGTLELDEAYAYWMETGSDLIAATEPEPQAA